MFEARFRAVRTLTLGAAFLLPTVAFAEVPKNPTFTKDIAPIFQEKCEACHRPDSIAPMSLKSFAEVRPWVRSIKSRVESRNMEDPAAFQRASYIRTLQSWVQQRQSTIVTDQ